MAGVVRTRTAVQCKDHWRDKYSRKREPWTKEEVAALERALVDPPRTQQGRVDWVAVSHAVGTRRGVECRVKHKDLEKSRKRRVDYGLRIDELHHCSGCQCMAVNMAWHGVGVAAMRW